MKIHPPPMVLKTQFDIDQVSDLLAWKFVRRDGQGEPDHGKDAGMINFTAGEAFHVQIEATSCRPFEGFEVVDCCLITKPFVYSCGPEVPTVYAPPSMFAPKEPGQTVPATIHLPGDEFKAIPSESSRRFFEITKEWEQHLTVSDFLGRWDMSFVLTVQIMQRDGTTCLRVFSFDPETDVSNGAIGMGEPLAACLDPETDPSSGTI